MAKGRGEGMHEKEESCLARLNRLRRERIELDFRLFPPPLPHPFSPFPSITDLISKAFLPHHRVPDKLEGGGGGKH